MKITRLRSGYVIRLSDSDFALLAAFAQDGECRTVHEYEDVDSAPLSTAGHRPAVQAAYTRRMKSVDHFMEVDEDRRIRR